MKQLTNTQVERILSLIIILYAIYCIGNDLGAIICSSINHFDSGLLQFIVISLQPIFDCAIFFFCRPIVQLIAYYATWEKQRSRRVWNAQELAALPFVFFAALQILGLVFSAIVVFPITLWNVAFSLRTMLFIQMPLFVLSILMSFAFAVVFLFFARSIAGWLLRRIEKTVY